jgi:hypothetical protein
MGELADLINKIVNRKNSNERYSIATVKAVDGLFIDASPVDGTADLMGIRLLAANDTKKFVCIPAVGSVVYIQLSSPTEGIVVGFSEVEEIYLRGDEFGGLVKVVELVTKLNNLENKVNTLITTFNAHVHPGVTTGPGSTAISATPVAGALTLTVRANIENQTVKHG